MSFCASSWPVRPVERPEYLHIAGNAWPGDTAIMAEAEKEAPQLPKHKIKYKKPFQRACNEKDEKGKLCGGHLKRWFYMADVPEQACGDVRQAFGDKAEIYRCEHCRTLYLPSEEEPTGRNVAGLGKPSVFGLTVENKRPDAKGE